MTPPPKPLRLRLQSPSDVLATVPYLLGFHPADSIVVIGLRGAGLVFQARGDLPPRSTSPAEIARFAGFLTDVLRAQAVTGALLVGYGTPERVTPTIMATAKAVHAVGVTVLDQLRTDAGRYWSYLCSNPACCPPEGVPYQIAGSVVAAEATLAGCVALPDRAALVRTLGPPAGPALAAIRLATAGAERQRSGVPRGQATAAGHAAVAAAVDRYTTGGRLTDDEVAWLTVLLAADLGLSGHVLGLVNAAPPETALHSTHPALWSDVVRRCDPDLVVAPAVLLAYASWRTGDGVLAEVAIERAMDQDPQSASAHLVADLLQRAVPPTAVNITAADLTAPAPTTADDATAAGSATAADGEATAAAAADPSRAEVTGAAGSQRARRGARRGHRRRPRGERTEAP